MNSQALGLRTSGTIFGIFCLVHLWRVFDNVDVVVGRLHVPIWGSIVALIVAGGLSIWMFRLSATRGG